MANSEQRREKDRKAKGKHDIQPQQEKKLIVIEQQPNGSLARLCDHTNCILILIVEYIEFNENIKTETNYVHQSSAIKSRKKFQQFLFI